MGLVIRRAGARAMFIMLIIAGGLVVGALTATCSQAQDEGVASQITERA